MVVAVGCGLVAAFLTTQINAKPRIETIEVFVAAKDLPVGTMLNQADLAKLVNKKPVPKDSLPPDFVTNEVDLIDKRLTRSMAKDEVFNPKAGLTKGGVVQLPDGKDMASASMSPVDAAAGFVGPGSKVDILARLNMGGTTEVFPLLIDMLVLAVNTHTSYDSSKGGVFPDMSMVSFAVSQEEALLLELAKQRGCHLSLLLRHPSKPRDPSYDMSKIKKMLESNQSPTKFETTSSGGRETREPPANPETPAPKVEAAKAEMVKVFVAVEDIAPNTEVTKDVLEKKLVLKEFPKEFAQGACTDPTTHFGKAFRYGVVKDQVVLDSVFGPKESKPAPPSNNIEEKPEPKAKPPVVARRTKDIAVHTATGTVVHRYEEIAPGQWRFLGTIGLVESTKYDKPQEKDSEKQPGSPEAAKQPGSPDTTKMID
jgi:Flp pilus assembly protein CpaB